MGRTISQLRRAVNTHLGALHNTQAYISLSSVRQIGVLVIGHVKNPGRKNLNAFHTVIDAISLAGGVQKDGSLRQIKLVRSGRSTIIDFYDLLMQGSAGIDLRLRDGDRLIIPTIGATIAVSGAVKRPAIYELTKAHPKLSMNDLLEFSGGVLSAGKNRFIKLALTAQGQETTTQITRPKSNIFGNSTILNVSHGRDKRASTIELSGHTNAAGLYDLSKHKTLGSLLQNQTIIGDDIYPLIGIIKRWDAQQLTTRLISFPMRLVLNSKFDIKMQDNDKVILLSNTDTSTVLSDNNYDTLTPEDSENNGNKHINDHTLKSFLKERSVFVRGAVRMPGLYPIAQGITLDNILAVAGGMTLEANKQSIEITTKNLGTNHQQHGRSGTQRTIIDLNTINPNTIELSAGDAVRVNQKYRKMDEKTVLIIGEINHPGNYDLLAGDKVSDLIARAGGVTDQAYPAGAIFSRESERRIEETRFRTSAHNMQRRLASAIEREKNPPNAEQIEMVRQLADELANIEAVGRITVETDPAILSTKPELDMLLEKNDRIYIPKRPLNVRVSGDVLSPASLQFRKDKDPLDYIKEAGGFTYDADKNRTFVIYPDGSAQPLKVSKWNHNPIFIPPGSTIIVPRDPKPFDFIESAKEVGQILSNLAITAVFIDDIRD